MRTPRATPRESFGRDYAASMAASSDPRLNYLRRRKAGLRSREDVEADVTRLFDPAITAAQGVGENVARVGATTLSAAAGLAEALPNLAEGAVEGIGRMTTRAGGSAQLTGSVLEKGARTGLATSILEGQRDLRAEERAADEDIMSVEEEQARTRADWLPYAQQRQQITTSALENKRLMADLKNAPVRRRREILENKLLKGQITAQDLQNTAFRAELRKLGLSNAQINSLATNEQDDKSKTKGITVNT
jgi:hypothetical protein